MGTNLLLDYGFRLPDDIFLQPERHRSPRNDANFAELGDRRFVRCGVPVPLTFHDDVFVIGMWIEVDPADFDRVVECWSDPATYRELVFEGRIANSFRHPDQPARELSGASVTLGTRDPDDRPVVASATTPWLAELLRTGWDETAYTRLLDGLFGHRSVDGRGYVCRCVADQGRPVRSVSHLDDGNWSFVCMDCDCTDVVVAHPDRFFADPAIAPCHWLPRDWSADRDAVGEPWKWVALPPEIED